MEKHQKMYQKVFSREEFVADSAGVVIYPTRPPSRESGNISSFFVAKIYTRNQETLFFLSFFLRLVFLWLRILNCVQTLGELLLFFPFSLYFGGFEIYVHIFSLRKSVQLLQNILYRWWPAVRHLPFFLDSDCVWHVSYVVSNTVSVLRPLYLPLFSTVIY